MSSAKFKEIVESHPIFKNLGDRDDQDEIASLRANQLMHVQDGSLYVWSNEESCFYVTNLRMSMDNDEPTVQKLLCTSPPLFQVRSVIFNNTGTIVALIGSRGVTVVTLPQKWRQVEEGEAVNCKCTSIAERFFMTCIVVQLAQALWHPASPNDCHLCLLLSDNTLRIYDIHSDNQTPTQVHKLGRSSVQSSRFSLASSAYSVSSAIGETAVSFAFAPPIEVQEKRKKILQARKTEEIPSVQLHPIYLLQGDGDVLLLLTSLTDKRYRKGLLHGPLVMQPAAEDNYGVDACSILVLQSTPTVLAIATAAGKIHHCVVLATNYDSDDEESETQSSASWPTSVLSVHSKGITNEFTPPMLFVYETVELDFDPQDENEEDKDFVNHTITLHSDPLLYCRYHCCTRLGIHAIVMPWLDKLATFFQAEDEDKDNLNEIAQDQPCVVEHVVCTKPTPSSRACAVKGVTFATNPLFGPSLLCLTADNHCSAVPLLTVFKPVLPPMTQSRDEATSEDDDTLTQSPNDFDFEDYIRSILSRDSSQPLLRYEASSRGTLVDREASRLINRVTLTLRNEYILKQKLAQDAIIKRVKLLAEQKQQLMKDIAAMEEKKITLTEMARELAERFEDCLDVQDSLSERLEKVLKCQQSKVPILSKAELGMTRELQTMSEKMKQLENRIKQVKAKHDYQNKQNFDDDGEGTKSPSQTRQPVANPMQVQKYKSILLEEGQKIQELVKKLNNIKAMVDS